MKKPLRQGFLAVLSALVAVVMVMCKPLERINAIRITGVSVSEDSLSVRVTGEIIDNNQNQEVEQHGFCASSTITNPEIGNANSDTLNLGIPADKANFSVVIDSLAPNRSYYIRPYMIAGGVVVYGATSTVLSKRIRFSQAALNLSTILFDENEIVLSAFVNKSEVEKFPVTLLKYGTVVSASPDSTVSATGAISMEAIPSTSSREYNIKDTYVVANIPNITAPNSDKIYVWLFIEFALKNDPSDIRRAYTRRKAIFKVQ